jgi:phospholipid transport system substrate-binding protein
MPRMLRLFLLASSLATCLIPLTAITPSLAANSDVANSIQTRDQAVQSPVGKFVQDLGDRAIKIVANKQMSAEQRNVEFDKILNNSFDLKTIGRFVIGRTWNTATPAQQAEYMDLFKALVIKNYSGQMALVTGDDFQVIGIRPESGTDTTVFSQFVNHDGSPPTSIDWRVRQKDGKMGVLDVVVEGISFCVIQRDEYTAVIKNSGGQINGLLEAMSDQLKVRTTTVSASSK